MSAPAPGPELRTERLLLRRWRERDRGPFAAINRDADVVRFLPAPLTPAQSDDVIVGIEAHFERHGYGLWALQRLAAPDASPAPGAPSPPDAPGAQGEQLLGFTGLNVVSFDAPFTPAVEVGWRLARAAWGHGYATEAARAALRFGFERAGLEQVVAMTVPRNARSRAVMERLAMTHAEREDFDHPRVPRGSPLRRHVLYRMSAARWREREAGVSRRARRAGAAEDGAR